MLTPVTRRAIAVAFLIALVLPLAGAAEDPNDPSIRRNVVSSRSGVGDWSAYEVKLRPLAEKDREPVRYFVTYRVKTATDKAFVIQTETEPFRSPEWPTREVPRETEKLRDLLDLGPEVVLSDFSSGTDKRTIGEREFACRRYEFTTTEGTFVQQNVVWIPGEGVHEMGGVRMIALQCKPVSGAARPLLLEMELRGWSRHGRQWGSSAKELLDVK